MAEKLWTWRKDNRIKKVVTSNVCNYPSFFFLADIQECYEVTLQLNKEQTVVKEESRQDAWEVIFLLHIIEHMFTLYLVSHVLLCAALSLLTKRLLGSQRKVSLPVSLSPTWIKCYHEWWQLWLQPGEWASDRKKLGRERYMGRGRRRN